jgi:hypothetical protein
MVFALDIGCYILLSYGLDANPPPISAPTMVAEAIDRLPSGQQWAVKRFDTTDNGITVARALQAGQAVALSDGLYKDQFGMSAMIIKVQDPLHSIVAVNIVPGNVESQGSF